MQKRNIFISLIILFLLIFVFAFQTTDDPKILYEKAKYVMETKGDLQEALTLFGQIIGNVNADRSLRAKAQLNIAMCKEKLGLKEAIKAYREVIFNYPEQLDEVALAKQRISILSSTLEKITRQPEFKKIRMPSKPGNGVLSPDGEKMAFIRGGSVWIIPVSGEVDPYIAGEPKKLTDDIGAWNMTSSCTWSRDGKWIAFNAKYNNKTNSAEVYIVSAEGSKPKRIDIPDRQCGWPEEFRVSLSPDGKILAYASGKDTGDDESELIRIFSIPVSGGNTRPLTGPWTQEPAFSPDGTKIAYVKYYRRKDGNRYSNVWVIPLAGGTPVQVTDMDSGQVRGPVWSPDGKMIAFQRRSEGENPKEIWIVPVSESGNPKASPVKIDLPLVSFHDVAGWTPNNKIGLQLRNENYEIIYTIPTTGGIATQVTPQGWASYPKWSKDGKRIFFRWDGGEIAFVPAAGGEVTTIPIDQEFGISEAVPGGSNDISPDGKKIVFSGAKKIVEDGKKRYEVVICTIPIEGGDPTRLTESPGQDRFPCWSPDGKHITYFCDDNTIRLITVKDGKSQIMTKVAGVNPHFELAWSPTGEKLAYTDKGKIWVVARDGGSPEEVKTGLDKSTKATKISWSPDGKKIAFTGYTGGEHELWFMENFLPLVKW